MEAAQPASEAEAMSHAPRVLNAGSGPLSARPLHQAFRKPYWREVRVDIDPRAEPDVLGSLTQMGDAIPTAGFDAIWSSHSLEHLHAHEVPLALAEFRRVLRPDGFVLINSPDLEVITSLMLERGPDHVAYVSPAGPITVLDMLFGHGDSIARGNTFMAHKTGFTSRSLTRLLVNAGFGTVLVERERFDLWALALGEAADRGAIQQQLTSAGLHILGNLQCA
jgi:SAM-dependent methyltransferase